MGPTARTSAAWDDAGPIRRSHGEVDSDRRSGRVRLRPHTLEATMQNLACLSKTATAIRNDLGAIFISLELFDRHG